MAIKYLDAKRIRGELGSAGSASFDGSNDKVTAGGTASTYGFLTGNGGSDWSLACWLKPTITHQDVFFDQCNAATAGTGVSFRFNVSGSDKKVQCGLSDGSTFSFFESSAVWTDSDWQHMCVTYDSSASTMTIYRNGVSAGSSSSMPSNNGTPTHAFTIGEAGAGNDNAYEGYMSDLLLTDDILSSTEISALASGTKVSDVSPAIDNQELHYTFSENFNDSSGQSGRNGTASGATISSSVYKFPKPDDKATLLTDTGKAWTFTNGKATASHQMLPTGTSAFTIMAWVKFLDFDSNHEVLRSGTADEGIEIWTNTNGLYWTGSSSSIKLENVGDLSTSAWTHIAISRNGSGTDYMYVNGVAASQNASTSSKTIPSITDWHIGGRHNDSEDFEGSMTQWLVYTDAKSQSDIQAVYNSGNATATPSTTNLQTFYNFAQTGSTLEDQEGSNDSTGSGTITKGVTGLPSSSSDLQENSIFNETDTRTLYFLQSGEWKRSNPLINGFGVVSTDTFTSGSTATTNNGWTIVNTDNTTSTSVGQSQSFFIDKSEGKLYWNGKTGADNSGSQAYYDLGGSMASTWILQFKLKMEGRSDNDLSLIHI